MTNSINTLILSALKDKSLYGLEIIKSIQNDTNGELVLKQPSLYSSLRRLETQGFVSSYWTDSDLGGKRHYYNITPTGLQYLKKKLSVSQAEENFFNDKAQQLSNKKELEKDEESIKQYAPIKHSGSFSDVMRKYVAPKNKYPEYELNKTTKNINAEEQNPFEPTTQGKPTEEQTTKAEQTEETLKNDTKILFPDVDSDLDFNKLLDDDISNNFKQNEALPENKFGSDINYKDILGDLYLDEEEVTPIISTTPKRESPYEKNTNEKNKETNNDDLKVLNKSREYAKQFASMLTSKDTNENPFAQKETPVNPNSIKLLEDISKRHKEKTAQKNIVDNEITDENTPIKNIDNEENSNQIISTETKIARTPPTISKENTKYILVNKLRIISQLILSTIMIFSVAILFIIYLTQNWLGLEQYILFGSALFIILLMLLIRFIQYKKYPDQKIRKKVKWGTNLLYRVITTVLLIIFAISINLLIGMNEFFRYDYLLRWLLPSLLLLNITVAWIVNITLAHKVKYQI